MDLSPLRAEAGRVLLTSSSHSGVTTDDRAYLGQIVTAATGLAPADADRRVDTVVSDSRKAISRARASGTRRARPPAVAIATACPCRVGWYMPTGSAQGDPRGVDRPPHRRRDLNRMNAPIGHPTSIQQSFSPDELPRIRSENDWGRWALWESVLKLCHSPQFILCGAIHHVIGIPTVAGADCGSCRGSTFCTSSGSRGAVCSGSRYRSTGWRRGR